MWGRAEAGAERLERGHSRENTGVVGPRERRGQPGVTGFFLLQVLFAWTERKTVEDRAGQSEQRVCLCASEGGAAGGSVSGARTATCGLTETKAAAILSLDAICKPSLIK